MKKYAFLLFLLIFTATVNGAEFSTITLKEWVKEELAADHLRFTHPKKKELILHIQVDSYDKDHFWNEQSLSDDIEKMTSVRKMMSSFLGTTDYQISNYKFEKASKTTPLPRLFLMGSYRRLDHQLIRFCEINFYYNDHFLQLKFISEGKLPDEKEIETIIKEINPPSMDID